MATRLLFLLGVGVVWAQQCQIGFYLEQEQCIVCSQNYFCPDGTQKLPCPANANSPSQSSSVAACACQDGFAYESISYSCVLQKYVFNYIGSVEEFQVPASVNEVNFKMWGAGGGGGGALGNYVEGGGAGGFSIGKMTAKPGDYLYVVVGGGGRGARNGGGGAGWPNGGYSNFPYYGGSKSGSGGGRSQISYFVSRQTNLNDAIRIPDNIAVIAGAGGGSGWTSGTWNAGEAAGQGGGGLVGNQHPSNLNRAGGQTAPPTGATCGWNTAGTCYVGSFLQGALGWEMTGAGGDGYYGGSGGGRNGCVNCACGCANNGGGAGGSSYFNPTFASGQTFSGQNGFPLDDRYPYNYSDPDNNFTVGRGGARKIGNSIDYGDCGAECGGQNGRIVLRMNGPSFLAMGSCKPGTYSPDPVKTWECSPCPEGEFCLGGAHHQICTLCPDGQYMSTSCSSDKDKVCTLCPVQHYCKDDQKIQCPEFSNTSTGSSSVEQCSDCLLGHVKIGPTSCRPCTAGYACPNITTTEIECQPRYFATSASTTCTLCQPGNECPNTTISLPCNGTKDYSQPGSFECNEKRCSANSYSWNATCVTCPSYHQAGVSPALSLSRLNCTTNYPCTPVNGICACDLAYTCGPTLNARCTLRAQGVHSDFEYVTIDGDTNNGATYSMPYHGAGLIWSNSFIQMELNGPTKILGMIINEHPGVPGTTNSLTVWVGNVTATKGCTSVTDCLKNSVQCTMSNWGANHWMQVPASGRMCDPNSKICKLYVCNQVGTYVTVFGSGSFTEMRPYGESMMNLPCTQCAFPTVLQGYRCSQCSVGSYANEAGDCVKCPENYFCNGTHKFDCMVPGVFCTALAAIPCPSGFYCPGDNVKVQCTGNSTAISGSFDIVNCTCNPGYLRLPDHSCRPCRRGYECPNQYNENLCPSGKYAEPTQTACATCPVGSFCPGDTSVNNCPLISSSLAGSFVIDNCTCNSGFMRLENYSCRPCSVGYECPNQFTENLCPRGKYAAPAQAACAPCAVGSFCPGDTTQNACPSLSTSVAGVFHVDNCTCVTAGWVRNGTFACRPCRAGYSCSNSFTETICPENRFSLAGSPTCSNCPTNSFSSPGSTSSFMCTCNASYLARIGDSYGNPSCNTVNSNCNGGPPGSVNLARSCGSGSSACPVTVWHNLGNSTWWPYYGSVYDTGPTWFNNDRLDGGIGVDNRAGNRFFTWQLDLETEKQLGSIYYWISAGWQGPRNAPMFIYAGEPMAICDSIYSIGAGWNKFTGCFGVWTRFVWIYQTSLDWHDMYEYMFTDYNPAAKLSCNACPAGSYCPDENTKTLCASSTLSSPGAVSQSQCSNCIAGYITETESSCKACRTGYRCPDKDTETICPAGSFSAAAATACTTCPANTYADAAGAAQCTACPANSLSSAGATAKSGCTCLPGYYRDINLNCIICPAGYICNANQLQSCNRGFFSNIGASACTACPRGTYSDNIAMPSCLSCPAGSVIVVENPIDIYHATVSRSTTPEAEDSIFIQRSQLPTSSSAFNITKWTFYASQACTVTPVILEGTANVGLGGYQTLNLQVTKVGTTRSVNVAGRYSFDFLTGGKVLTKQFSLVSGTSNYRNLEYLGWYYDGPACIPYDQSGPPSPNGNSLTDYVVSVHPYNKSADIKEQMFPNNIDVSNTAQSARKDTIFSVALTYSISVTGFATPNTASTTIFNCSCSAGLRVLSDGNCQGLCVDGKYMAQDTDEFCTTCPQGSYCTKSLRHPCPSQQSSPPQSGLCYACPGPDTHSSVSLHMCGLRTCQDAQLQQVPGTQWMALGRITVGLGGNGVIPHTSWHTGYKCLGMVLNASADRPVAVLQHTLAVTAGKTYALRLKKVCTGVQCGVQLKVTWLQQNTVLYSKGVVARSWVEGATPYFTPTTNTITIQFHAQMVTSSATVWLGPIELVDLGQWSYSDVSNLLLNNGVDLPVRYNRNYAQTETLVLMQLSAGAHIEQSAGVLPGHAHELIFWHSGDIVPEFFNGSEYVAFTAGQAYDTAPGYTQGVYYMVPTSSPLQVRFRGTGSMTRATFKIYEDMDRAPCKLCLESYWCTGGTLNRCPLNTISHNGSMRQSECFCAPGYYGNVGLGDYEGYSPCALCTMNHYCSGGNHKEYCPPGTKSMPGATLAGCTPCAEGEYCDQGLVGICPMNSWSPTGSDEVEDCACQPGYYGTRGNCTLCQSGFYCPGSPERLACTAHAVSPVGSVTLEQCFCDRGYYGVNNTPCTACQEGYWCWTGVRNLCPPNMWSPTLSSFQINCTCEYGYTGPDGGPCASCSTGTYKTERGPAACTLCAVGTSSPAVAALSADTCASCARGSFNPYTGQSACLLCDAGTAAGEFGSTACADCNPGTWSPQGAATCTSCLAGTFSTAIAAPSVATCQTCAAGAYSGMASTSCSLCGACSFWSWPMRITAQATGSATTFATLATNMQPQMTLISPTTAVVSDSSNLFRMDINTGTLTPQTYDAQGSFMAFTHVEASRDRTSIYLVQGGSAFRLGLPDFDILNSYSGTGPNGITESATGSHVWVSFTAHLKYFDKDTEMASPNVNYPSPFTSVTAGLCVHSSYPSDIFVAGRSGDGVFGFRKYNTVTNTWTTITTALGSVNKCAFTPEGQFVLLTTLNSVNIYSLTENTVLRIFTGQVHGMVIDPLASFVLMGWQSKSIQRQAILIQDARNCGQGKFSLSAGLPSESMCEVCPEGSLCPSGNNITQCSHGTYSLETGRREQGQCTPCEPGKYCTGGTHNTLCPLGSYSLSHSVPSAEQCSKCPANFFCVNTTVIESCPPNTNSPVGSSDLGQCVCNPGYKCEVTSVVHAEVTLPITIVDFEALRQQYILAVAAAAGVDPSQVVIVSVTTSGSGGASRRLLGADDDWTEVHTNVYGSKYHAKPHLALATLQHHLALRGLPRHRDNIRFTLHHEVQHSQALASYKKN